MGGSSIRHACCCRSGQCARNQQVGCIVSRRGWTVEELDSEPVHGQQHGDMMCDSEVSSWRTGECKIRFERSSNRRSFASRTTNVASASEGDAVPHSRISSDRGATHARHHQKRGSTDCRSGARRHTDRVQFSDSSRKPDGTSLKQATGCSRTSWMH